jgi:hypothetical protein
MFIVARTEHIGSGGSIFGLYLEVPSSALGWDIDYPESFWFFVDLSREILSNTLT